jgi:hypothetical protein
MRAGVQDKTTIRFKMLLALSFGILAIVIALGEMGII